MQGSSKHLKDELDRLRVLRILFKKGKLIEVIDFIETNIKELKKEAKKPL
jgi:hypothetical protein